MNVSEVESLLVHFEKDTPLSNLEKLQIASFVSIGSFKKGEYLLRSGNVCKETFFIVSGCVRIYYSDQKGVEHTINFGISDWWVSDIKSFITQEVADYNIQCLANTEVIILSFDKQEQLLQVIPRLERVFKKKLEKALVVAQKRIVDGFSLTAKERYLQFRERYASVEVMVPQYMVASYLGITKEFLSKMKKELG